MVTTFIPLFIVIVVECKYIKKFQVFQESEGITVHWELRLHLLLVMEVTFLLCP